MDKKFLKPFSQLKDKLKPHQSKCQFSEIGCMESKNHLDNNNSLHLNLLMNTLQNLNNEMEIYKEKCSKNENLINNLNVELIQMKEENDSLKSQLVILETYKEKCNENEILINELNAKLLQTNYSLESKIDSLGAFEQNQKTINNQINTQLNGFVNGINVMKNSIDRLNSETIDCAPFQYEIVNFLNIINSNSNEYILTEEFLSEPGGYTMQLKIFPSGKGTDLNRNLTIEFGIIEGQYDDILEWPMQRKVVIAVINHYTNEIHVCQIFHLDNVRRRFKCTFHKPSKRSDDDDNYFYGTRNLISLNDLINNNNLCMNGSIVVRCFVD